MSNQLVGQCIDNVDIVEVSFFELFGLFDKDFRVHFGRIPLGATHIVVILFLVDDYAQSFSYF